MTTHTRTATGPESFGQLSPRNIGAMLVLAILWGVSIPVTKLGLQTLPPLSLTALRFAIAVPLLFLLAYRRLALPRAALAKSVALGVIGIGVGQVAQTFGVQGTTASVGTILSATIPLFVVIFAALRLRQAITRPQKIGLILAFLGMVLVANGQGQDGGAWGNRHWLARHGCCCPRSASLFTMSGVLS